MLPQRVRERGADPGLISAPGLMRAWERLHVWQPPGGQVRPLCLTLLRGWPLDAGAAAVWPQMVCLPCAQAVWVLQTQQAPIRSVLVLLSRRRVPVRPELVLRQVGLPCAHPSFLFPRLLGRSVREGMVGGSGVSAGRLSDQARAVERARGPVRCDDPLLSGYRLPRGRSVLRHRHRKGAGCKYRQWRPAAKRPKVREEMSGLCNASSAFSCLSLLPSHFLLGPGAPEVINGADGIAACCAFPSFPIQSGGVIIAR